MAQQVILTIGTGLEQDPSVILGYVPTRPISDYRLVIGRNAHLRSGTVIYAGTQIGNDFWTGHNVVIREENRLGDDVSVGANSVVDYGCVIGHRVKIHTGVYVAQFTIIEDDVFLAPGVMLANDPHPGCEFSRQCMRGPTIKRGAQIGVNVTLLPFVTIGENALIGAGSVVTRDVPPRSVAAGNPVRVLRTIDALTCLVQPPLTERPYPRVQDDRAEERA